MVWAGCNAVHTILNYMKKTIITKRSKQPGKKVAIVAGVHGNETVGCLLLDLIIEKVVPRKGTIHFIYGNPKGIEQNVRFTETNLNRNFHRDNNNASYEEKRAHELMNIFDECDAVLDLHAYNEPDLNPATFAICEPLAFSVVRALPVPVVLSGFNEIQKGSTNGYMEEREKIGIVLELGSVNNPGKYLGLAQTCLLNFLSYFDLIDSVGLLNHDQEYFKVAAVYRKNNEYFRFSKKYSSFDAVNTAEIVATDGLCEIAITEKSSILFPRENTQIGGESFWLLTKTD